MTNRARLRSHPAGLRPAPIDTEETQTAPEPVPGETARRREPPSSVVGIAVKYAGICIRLWYLVRRDAGIEDVRLHDLRHTMASHAVMNGVPVPVVSRLLGHSSTRMTLRYAHAADRDIEAAAEQVGQAIGAIMDVGPAPERSPNG